MRRMFGRSAERRGASLAVLLAIGLTGQAEAAGPSPATDGTTRSPASLCGESDGGCGRIRGHIAAASDTAGMETIGAGPASAGAPLAPLMSDLGAAGKAAADTVSRGLFLLQVSHDPSAR
jgi:hypothetical protein